MLGIEKLKEAVHVAVSLQLQFAKATRNNKFKLLDIFGFVDEFQDLWDMFKDRKSVLAELKDLTPEERVQLLEYIKSEFDLPNDQLEAFIEDALKWSESTISMVERAKSLKKAS